MTASTNDRSGTFPAGPLQYLFAGFVLSPSRRQLLKEGAQVALIPRYFDLLLLLIEHRHRAVTRREIMETVWSDVIVSDGALSQAVRTLRRSLGDDSRSPSFIGTVSRHGYRFIFDDVVEEPDGGPAPETHERPRADPMSGSTGGTGASEAGVTGARDVSTCTAEVPFEDALATLLGATSTGALTAVRGAEDPERRDAAETLHALGTAEALRRLDGRPGHETARALLRDTRWDVPGSGEVPLLGAPGGLVAARVLIGLRLRRAARHASARWASASAGGAVAGAIAGTIGGAVLLAAPGGHASVTTLPAVAVIAACIGGLGAAGVGAGLAAAEALARSLRGPALVIMGSFGGGLIGALSHLLGAWTLQGLFGRDLSAVGGGYEGLVLGAAAGLGYAVSTPRPGGGGMATPRGRARLSAAIVTGLCCAAGAVILTYAGGNLGGVSLDTIARKFQGSEVGLAPVARLLGEDGLGPLTRTVFATYEGLFFGTGLVLGLTRRPR